MIGKIIEIIRNNGIICVYGLSSRREAWLSSYLVPACYITDAARQDGNGYLYRLSCNFHGTAAVVWNIIQAAGLECSLSSRYIDGMTSNVEIRIGGRKPQPKQPKKNGKEAKR